MTDPDMLVQRSEQDIRSILDNAVLSIQSSPSRREKAVRDAAWSANVTPFIGMLNRTATKDPEMTVRLASMAAINDLVKRGHDPEYFRNTLRHALSTAETDKDIRASAISIFEAALERWENVSPTPYLRYVSTLNDSLMNAPDPEHLGTTLDMIEAMAEKTSGIGNFTNALIFVANQSDDKRNANRALKILDRNADALRQHMESDTGTKPDLIESFKGSIFRDVWVTPLPDQEFRPDWIEGDEIEFKAKMHIIPLGRNTPIMREAFTDSILNIKTRTLSPDRIALSGRADGHDIKIMELELTDHASANMLDDVEIR